MDTYQGRVILFMSQAAEGITLNSRKCHVQIEQIFISRISLHGIILSYFYLKL